MTAQVACLERAGFSVVVPSLPGFGDSECPTEVGAYSLPSLLQVLLGLLDQLGVGKVRFASQKAVQRVACANVCAQQTLQAACSPQHLPACLSLVSQQVLPGCVPQVQGVVVGHDWGASLAWFMAMKAPERVFGLVALSVGHAGERGMGDSYVTAP